MVHRPTSRVLWRAKVRERERKREVRDTKRDSEGREELALMGTPNSLEMLNNNVLP